MSKIRIVRVPEGPWQHLQPMIDAEIDWGNSTRNGMQYCGVDNAWNLRFSQPLHVDALRAAFSLPEGVCIGSDDEGGTSITDGMNGYVFIDITGGSRVAHTSPKLPPRITRRQARRIARDSPLLSGRPPRRSG